MTASPTFVVENAVCDTVCGICVDGVSLTVNAVDGEGFEVALIPHTVSHTAFSTTKVGDAVNLEVDLVARYVERLLAAREVS